MALTEDAATVLEDFVQNGNVFLSCQHFSFAE